MKKIPRYSIAQLLQIPESEIAKIAVRIGDPGLGLIEPNQEFKIRKDFCRQLFEELKPFLRKMDFKDWLKPFFKIELSEKANSDNIPYYARTKLFRLIALLPEKYSKECRGIINEKDNGFVIVCFYQKTDKNNFPHRFYLLFAFMVEDLVYQQIAC